MNPAEKIEPPEIIPLPLEMQKVNDKLNWMISQYPAEEPYLPLITKIFYLIESFSDRIRKEFPKDHKKYPAWHALCRSAMVRIEDSEAESDAGASADEQKIDFPGDFSVVKFVHDLEAEMQKEEQKIVERVEDMRDRLYKSIDKETGERMIKKVHAKICVIADRLRKEHPDAEDCYLLHVMAYSTKKREACSKFDFSGDDSIVKILEELCDEYLAEEQK